GSSSYYVSLTGSDNNAGTKDSPFKTLFKISNLHLKAGDTVYFKSEQVFNGSLLLSQSVIGTINKPVVITSYGKGHAIINAKDSVGINVSRGAYIKLQHLTLIGSGRKTGNVKDGVAIDSCMQISIEDLNISGFQKSGLLIFSSKNVIAKNVFAHDNG